MGWLEAIGAALKLAGMILQSKKDKELTQEKLDAAVKALKPAPPPKEN